ncbi:hypothetical protein HDV05_005804 [Chytridiales sp. JEL 0842]|nr:hypothetical protein HDV05_005804 [Chytridiales sp. JEL 0842]
MKNTTSGSKEAVLLEAGNAEYVYKPIQKTPVSAWQSRAKNAALAALGMISLRYFFFYANDAAVSPANLDFIVPAEAPPACGQVEPLVPKANPQLQDIFESRFSVDNKEFAAAVAEKLGGMVRFETASYDDMKTPPPPVDQPDDDSRRAGLPVLHEYLTKTWPLVHKTLEREIVNRYGLIYTWKGSDESLKPILLMAHMDTVPVPKETIDNWTYPPFSGKVADGYIWGRGAVDCKAQVTSVLESIENLIAADFKPKRTILVSFGFDEEISGRQGAGEIAQVLEKRYGQHNIEFIVDEGTGLESEYGSLFAYLAVAEKGYMDVQFIVETPGGHSSVPSPHTGIGFLAKVISNLEDNPFPLAVPDDSPYLKQLQCAAAHGTSMDPKLRSLVNNVTYTGNPEARAELVSLLSKERVPKALIGTTQAVDIIAGGVKVNALPEIASATVNFRIASHSSVVATEDRLLKVSSAVTKAFNLNLVQLKANGQKLVVPPSNNPSVGTLTIKTLVDSLEPSPQAPQSGKPYQLLAGTVRHLVQARTGENAFVSPGAPTGNTDTRYVHNLSRHVFRFSPLRDRPSHNIHTVDEKCGVDTLVEACGFFFQLIRNVDEASF